VAGQAVPASETVERWAASKPMTEDLATKHRAMSGTPMEQRNTSPVILAPYIVGMTSNKKSYI
jgi:hypothetical protein